MKATGEASAIGWHHRLALRLRPRSILVAAQVALSLILLAGAALLIESLAGLSRVQPGFEPRNLLSMQITLPKARHQELVRRVESIPGVEAAAITLTLPMTRYDGTPVQAAGQPPLKLNERPIAILQTVTPGYFRTLGIPMRHGRDFTLGDTSTTPLVGTGLRLVIVGIYGVMAYSVGQRTREMGIHRALGAPEGHILGLVLAQGLSVAMAGVTFGLAGAVALTRAMQGLLYRISPTDPLTLGGVAFLLIVVTIAASYLPAQRAIRISPTAAMNGL